MKTSLITLVTLCTLMAGCASRSALEKDNPIKPVADLYNRNFVVAAPTLAGNVICGAPFLALSTGMAAVYSGERSERYYRTINNVHVLPAAICGAITGAVFVPVSWVCAEDPWDLDFKTIRRMGWACRSAQDSAEER
jgi:hypothetical protein